MAEVSEDDEESVHLMCLGLDGWEYCTYTTCEGEASRRVHEATVGRHPARDSVGRVAAARFSAFCTAFTIGKATAATRTGPLRHSKAGGGGHQKTPAFVAAVARWAVDIAASDVDLDPSKSLSDQGIELDLKPVGGFTDVGLHTGGDEKRDTALPLESAAVQLLLDEHQPPLPHPSDTYDKLLAAFALSRAGASPMALLVGDTDLVEPADINNAMDALADAARRGAALAGTGRVDVRAFMQSCEDLRARLERCRDERAAVYASRFDMPLPDASQLLTLPSPLIPHMPEPPTADAAVDQEAIRALAAKNLAAVPHLGGSASLHDALHWAKAVTACGGADAQAVLFADTERFVFDLAMQLPLTAAAPGRSVVRSAEELTTLEALVSEYRTAATKFRNDSASRGLLKVGLASREVLVVWCTYSLTHQLAQREHPELRAFAVSLRPTDLEHLVLDDKHAWDTLCHVAEYLHVNTQARTAAPFSGFDASGTYKLADACGARNSHLREIWSKESNRARVRMEEWWAEVQIKKSACEATRTSIRHWEAEKAEAVRTQHLHPRDLSRRRDCDANLASLNSQLKREQAAPNHVYQSLPRAETAGLRAVFFCHMPVLLRRLAAWSYAAYDVLGGGKDGVSERSTESLHNLLKYHDDHSALDTSWSAPWEMVPFISIPTLRSINVEECFDPQDGTWHPGDDADGRFLPRLVWEKRCNPFRTSRGAWVDRWTEQLGVGDSCLQPALRQAGTEETARERGGAGPARLSDKPSWLSKPAYLAFWAVRAYPLQQIRKLCACLHDNLLPLTHAPVHTLVRQALYHVGALSVQEPAVVEPSFDVLEGAGAGAGAVASTDTASCGGVHLQWKDDLLEGEAAAVLLAELAKRADDLAGAPRDHEAVQLLGEIAAFLSGFAVGPRIGNALSDGVTPMATALSRRISRIAERWADDLEPQVITLVNACKPQQAAQLQAKQHEFLGYAIASFGTSDALADADAGRLCALRVRMCTTQPLLGADGVAAAVPTCAAAARAVMAARAADIAARLSSPSLTAAVQHVLPALAATLTWTRGRSAAAGQVSSCFEALSDGNLVSVNVLTGRVLFNGLPPNFLPHTVVTHPLYKRTFGERNCHVVLERSGVMRTARPLKGRHYTFFHPHKSSQLVVHEEVSDPGASAHNAPTTAGAGTASGSPVVRYQLLDCLDSTALRQWGSHLPRRLCELHSHWYTADLSASAEGGGGVLVLRPQVFSDHRIQFLATTTAGSVTGAGCEIFRIPPELATSTTAQLLGRRAELDRMISTPIATEPLAAADAATPAPHPVTEVSRLTEALAVLVKFEPPAFTEVYATPARSLVVVLPRYRLEFELHSAVSVSSGLAAPPQWVSRDHRGYALAPCQQLPDTLHGFSQYLVLQAQHPDSIEMRMATLPSTRFLVPKAEVRGGGLGTKMDVPKSAGAALETYTFNEHHRYRSLTASSIEARLQLAALYAATASLLAESRTRMTGGEQAMALLRQCWVNRRLSAAEESRRLNVLRFADHCRTPGVRLLCQHLVASSSQLAWLHAVKQAAAGTDSDSPPWATPEAVAFAETEYALRSPVGPRSSRAHLTAEEEATCCIPKVGKAATRGLPYHASGFASGRSVGSAEPGNSFARVTPLPHIGRTADTDEAGAASVVPELEAGLAALTTRACTMKPAEDQPFPLELYEAQSTRIGQKLVAELKASWAAHQSTTPPSLRSDPSRCLEFCRSTLHGVLAKQERLERRIHEAVDAVPVRGDAGGVLHDCHPNAMAFRLLRAGGDVPKLTRQDVVRSAWYPLLYLDFNPFLSAAKVAGLHACALEWMRLCVLEDKLRRSIALLDAAARAAAAAGAVGARSTAPLSAGSSGPSTAAQPALSGGEARDLEARAARELSTGREWSVYEHPQWLAFEVEQGLQIRPEQYAVIQSILAGDGNIAQLNMGLGKTRVIVPCLLLHWTAPGALAHGTPAGSTERCIVRVHFLQQLLHEAYDYLHACLTASVLARKLFLLPFHRDVELDAGGRCARAIGNVVRHCQRVGGALIVAPEARLSMQLKQHELQLAPPASAETGATAVGQPSASAAGLQAIDALPYHDIFDESDDMLHHRKQLIYAAGAQQPLPAGPNRWSCIQAVFFALRHDDAVRELVGRAGVSNVRPDAALHEYNDLRLLPGKPLEAVAPCIGVAVLQALIDQPPRHLLWLNEAPPPVQKAVIRAATDVNATFEALLPPSLNLTNDQCDDVLTLRGLLAHGVLLHCLQKRHRVDYGIPPTDPPRPKRLAVPFIAADTPTLRSEFAQPECALVFTMLGYYQDGLSHDNLREAFDVLLELGDTAQRKEYGEWFALSADSIADPATRASIDSVIKVDLSNGAQWELLYTSFSRNMRTVDFWLNSCVLPQDTAMYPQRLMATSWHIAHGGRYRCGFSGTNDASLLLPGGVQDVVPASPELHGTNGKMVECLLAKARYCTLPPPSSGAADYADAIVAFALAEGADALIDVGALMTGRTNAAVAQLVLRHLATSAAASGSASGAASAAERSPAASTGVPALGSRPPRLFKGVVFFDTAARKWTLTDLRGRSWPLESSPIAERDAFVFFDQSRCRGADLKLRADAVGMITLSDRLTKSELMQAAGRMRGLDYGQTLVLAAPPHVDGMIRDCCHLSRGPSVGSGAALAATPSDGGSSARSFGSAGAPASSSVTAISVSPPAAAPTTAAPNSPAATSAAVLVKHVLEFTMCVAIEATAAGLFQWATHGIHFATRRGNVPSSAYVDDEHIELQHLYGPADAPLPVSQAITQHLEATLARPRALLDGASTAAGSVDTTSLELVKSRAAEFGRDITRVASSHDEECERELEKEVEAEEEEERQLPSMEALPESDWPAALALAVASPAALDLSLYGVSVPTLGAYITSRLPQLRAIAWTQPRGTVYVTSNFVGTVKATAAGAAGALAVTLGGCIGGCEGGGEGDYLRPLDLLLLYPASGDVLLLSEREGERVLQRLWNSAEASGAAPMGAKPGAGACAAPAVLCNFAFLRARADRQSATRAETSVALQMPAAAAASFSDETMAALQLFAGEATFATATRRSALKRLLAREGATPEAELLLRMRGTSHLFDRSDLQEACRQVQAQAQASRASLNGSASASAASAEVVGKPDSATPVKAPSK